MITIWHNPRCSKSRQTLELLRSRGLQPEVVEYLRNPPEPREIRAVLDKLGMTPRELMRKSESAYRENHLEEVESDARLLEAMYHHPVLIERPVVITDEAAALGRPPEAVLKII